MSNPCMAIIGAGPGGLNLARILQHNGMDCTIFELDYDRAIRDQGGIVDLHPQSGQLALKQAGLLENFRRHALPAAEAMKLIKPEIDRSALRNILLDSIKPDSIQWNRKLLRVEPSKDHAEKYDLHFTDSTESGFDLVVGADGAWSKVRTLLTPQLPYYSGITIIELRAADVSTHKPWLSSFVGSRSLFRIRVYVGLQQPETWFRDCGIDWTKQNTARQLLVDRYFRDCGEDIKRVIATEASDGLRTWPLSMLPIGTTWSPRQGVTLLGNTAHLMTPFAGVGVNVALADALDLAKSLLKRKDAFEVDVPSKSMSLRSRCPGSIDRCDKGV